jgi:ABC-type glycerol-3-phosphate transport system substrate-binding protein
MKKVFILFLFLSLLIFLPGFGCKDTVISSKIKDEVKDVNLSYWRVWDDSSDFNSLVNTYKSDHPYINVSYKKVRYENLRDELIEAWSRDKGPDIFSIPVSALGEFIADDRLDVMPVSSDMVYVTVINEEKGEKLYERKINKMMTSKDIQINYMDTVYKNVVRNNEIYGVPLSVDTLVLYYNRDILNNARIPSPPVTWSQFKEDVKKITLLDRAGNIIQSGTSLGLVDNIDNSFDIISLLMMQNGSPMNCGDGFCVGGSFEKEEEISPGMDAIIFYTDFANPKKQVYSWNEKMPSAVNAFAEGKVAFFLGYSYHKEQIEALNPSLNFFVTKVPQIDGSSLDINYADYWVEVVSNKSNYKNEAWDFINFISKDENLIKYLKNTEKPTAKRSLIQAQYENYDMQSYLDQLLSSKNWYKGNDFEKAKSILNDTIMQVLNSKNLEEEINQIEDNTNSRLDLTW